MIDSEKRQIARLRSLGYNVVPMIADTFSWNGKYLSSGILDNNPISINYHGFHLTRTAVKMLY